MACEIEITIYYNAGAYKGKSVLENGENTHKAQISNNTKLSQHGTHEDS